MNTWWQQLSARDRRVLVLGSMAVMAILYVFALRMPAHHAVDQLEIRVQQQQQLAEWMQHARGEIQALRDQQGQSSVAGRRALYSVADESARTADLDSFLERVEPAGDDGARLRFDDVAFDELLEWLIRIRREREVVANRVTVHRSDKPGRVEARLILQRAR